MHGKRPAQLRTDLTVLRHANDHRSTGVHNHDLMLPIAHVWLAGVELYERLRSVVCEWFVIVTRRRFTVGEVRVARLSWLKWSTIRLIANNYSKCDDDSISLKLSRLSPIVRTDNQVRHVTAYLLNFGPICGDWSTRKCRSDLVSRRLRREMNTKMFALSQEVRRFLQYVGHITVTEVFTAETAFRSMAY